jgi:hypothetical protein
VVWAFVEFLCFVDIVMAFASFNDLVDGAFSRGA